MSILSQTFLEMLVHECMTTLQKLQKWHSSSRNLKIWDIVVIWDVSLVPGHWPLARVTATYQGDDGIVWVVTVKTAKGTYNRPVHKLVLLLTQDVDWTYEHYVNQTVVADYLSIVIVVVVIIVRPNYVGLGRRYVWACFVSLFIHL